MSTHFATVVSALRTACGRSDSATAATTAICLRQLRGIDLHVDKHLLTLYECLLFLRAHPSDAVMLRIVESALRRVAVFVRRHGGDQSRVLENSGLPFTTISTRFSHDCLRWLLSHRDCTVAFDAFSEPSLDLNAVLGLTLPLLERPETTRQLSNEELLDALGVTSARRLPFLVAELSRLDSAPFVKDQLFDALDIAVRVTGTRRTFSTAFNRLPMTAVHFQPAPLRTFDAKGLITTPLPPARRMNATGRHASIDVIRNAMTLTSRETDPASYTDVRSLRLFDLEHGISIAIFGMTPDRQLGLESYVGFTAFRNGLAIAYGGAWLFGERAEFGMNIFEPYRGGESSFLMCQLLRVYAQSFGANYFEVDAHQFGLDNPDGIASGAFWFYYRYGFRPIDRALAALARREKARIAAKPGTRSTRATLRRFTESNVALRLSDRVPPTLADIRTRVTRMVRRYYRGDRVAAEQDCIDRFRLAVGLAVSEGADHRGTTRHDTARTSARRHDGERFGALAEFALVARALRVTDATELQLLVDMIDAKPVDVYRYQRLLAEFIVRRFN